MNRPLASIFPVLCVFLAALCAAHAGTIRHDRNDSLYTDLANDAEFEGVGRVFASGSVGSGVVVAQNWVLTAAHVTEDRTYSEVEFWLDGETYGAAQLIEHPSYWTLPTGAPTYDLTLIRLRTPCTVDPAVLYTGTQDMGKQATYVGYGLTGTGLTGSISGTGGTKRAGTNDINSFTQSNRVMLCDFDKPGDPSQSSFGGSTPNNLEYCPAPGDSGGGVYITISGQTYLAGVISYVLAAPPPDGSADSNYGDQAGATRVNQFATSWILPMMGSGQTCTWVGSSVWYRMYPTWSTGFVPGYGDTAAFSLAGPYNVNFADNYLVDRVQVTAGEPRLNLAGHTYVLNGLGGTALVVGDAPGSTAHLVVNNGAIETPDVTLAPQAGDDATITVKDTYGRLTINDSLDVGKVGTGTLRIELGALVENQDAVLGVADGSYGLAFIDGTDSTWACDGDVTVGLGGGGYIDLDGGALVATGAIEVGTHGQTGRIAWDAGALTAPGGLTVGADGQLDMDFVFSMDDLVNGAMTGGAVNVTSGEVRLQANAGATQAAADVRVGSLTLLPGGSYTFSGGSLTVDNLVVAGPDFTVTTPTEDIEVRGLVSIGGTGRFVAQAPTTVAMTGAAFHNTSTATQQMEQVTLAFLGGPGVTDPFEAASAHLGLDPSGWVGNSALAGLLLGDATTVGRIAMEDAWDNRQDGDANEALYVDTLSFGAPGSWVDLGSTDLFYLNGGDPKQLLYGDANLDGLVDTADYFALAASWFGSERTWYEGDFTGDGFVDTEDYFALSGNWFVGGDAVGGCDLQAPCMPLALNPEPATLALTAAGLVALLYRRRSP